MAVSNGTALRMAQASIAEASWHLSNHTETRLAPSGVYLEDIQSLLALLEALLTER